MEQARPPSLHWASDQGQAPKTNAEFCCVPTLEGPKVPPGLRHIEILRPESASSAHTQPGPQAQLFPGAPEGRGSAGAVACDVWSERRLRSGRGSLSREADNSQTEDLQGRGPWGWSPGLQEVVLSLPCGRIGGGPLSPQGSRGTGGWWEGNLARRSCGGDSRHPQSHHLSPAASSSLETARCGPGSREVQQGRGWRLRSSGAGPAPGSQCAGDCLCQLQPRPSPGSSARRSPPVPPWLYCYTGNLAAREPRGGGGSAERRAHARLQGQVEARPASGRPELPGQAGSGVRRRAGVEVGSGVRGGGRGWGRGQGGGGKGAAGGWSAPGSSARLLPLVPRWGRICAGRIPREAEGRRRAALHWAGGQQGGPQRPPRR
nr:translation initiation factor IF-2-like [Pan troglodytes]